MGLGSGKFKQELLLFFFDLVVYYFSMTNTDVFVARQPIFDSRQEIFGYEFLFRDGLENFFKPGTDVDYASSKTLLDSLFIFGFNELTKGKKMFMNFSRQVLLSEAAFVFPSDLLVIELLETMAIDPEVTAMCKRLNSKGYMIALDDFEYHESFQAVFEYVDIIKIDFLLTKEKARSQVVSKVNSAAIKYLAEKIETNADFDQAKEMGYSYFQGYFFSKPVIISGKDVSSSKFNLMEIIREVNKPEININMVDKIISRDVSLSYKLLRFINSPAFGIANEIHSIRQALNLIGLIEFKKWISLIVLAQIGSDKPEELVLSSIIRAKFCELISEHIHLGLQKNELFLMGLFSFIDVFLSRPMNEVLRDLPLTAKIKDALLGKNNIYQKILLFIMAYEKGDWQNVAMLSTELQLENNRIAKDYLTAINWANNYQSS
jgi:EAL and modified HD-GYP domain-containing signal transduction protein